MSHNKNWLVNRDIEIKTQAVDAKQHELLLQSWKLTISEIETTYDDKADKMIYDGSHSPMFTH